MTNWTSIAIATRYHTALFGKRAAVRGGSSPTPLRDSTTLRASLCSARSSRHCCWSKNSCLTRRWKATGAMRFPSATSSPSTSTKTTRTKKWKSRLITTTTKSNSTTSTSNTTSTTWLTTNSGLWSFWMLMKLKYPLLSNEINKKKEKKKDRKTEMIRLDEMGQ